MDDHQTITLNTGVELAYLEQGSGPLVVLCHGFPDTAHSWDIIRPVLADAGYRVVTPFLRGYFPSSLAPNGRYDSDTIGRDLLALIEALGGGEPAVLIGHDWGASAAYSAAGLEADKIRLLVTLAIPHPASLSPSPTILWAVRHFLTLRLPGAVRRTRANNFAVLDELVERWSPGWEVPPTETEAVKRALGPPGYLDAALGYYRALRLRLPKGHKARIDVPTVCFAGLDDIIDPIHFDRAASRFERSYQVIRMPGGHFMHRQHPEHFQREILKVLDEHAPTR